MTGPLRVETAHFGPISVDVADRITFPYGWIGHADLRHFALLDIGAAGPVGWLQSLEDPRRGAPVTIPELFGASSEELVAQAEEWCAAADDTIVLVMATTADGGTFLTGNLRAPLLVGRSTRRGGQIVLDSPDLPLRAKASASSLAWRRVLPLPMVGISSPLVSV